MSYGTKCINTSFFLTGIEKFKGLYLHSWEYRDQKGFEGKKVLVVGAGNSGGDIAVEISRTAAKVSCFVNK